MDKPLVVIDISGVHTVAYASCGCPHELQDGLLASQLMSVRWWPASFQRPSTVATLRTLKLYHSFALQSKMNVYDFWNALVRITDGAGLRAVPVSPCIMLYVPILTILLCSHATKS
jgi:hypothetical protein